MPSKPVPPSKSMSSRKPTPSRKPRGPQGWGMNTSKGSVTVKESENYGFRPTRKETQVSAESNSKKVAKGLAKTALNSKASGAKGKKVFEKVEFRLPQQDGGKYISGRRLDPKKPIKKGK